MDRQKIYQRGQTADELYRRTLLRKMELEKAGFMVVEFWQCKFMAILKTNKKLRELWRKTASADLVPPLNPRKHGLRGGRVEPFVLHTEIDPETEVMEHFDIVNFLGDNVFNLFSLDQSLSKCYEKCSISTG